MINNLYKKTGKIFIHKKNLSLVLGVFLFLAFSVCFYSIYNFSKLNKYETKLDYLQKKSISSIDKRKQIKDFIARKTNFDKLFIENKLESLTFLENEKPILSKMLKHPAFSNSLQIKNRLEFINNDQNKLKFLEENIKKSTLIKEADLTQLKSVELDKGDLEKLLSIIEDVKIDNYIPEIESPQLIIKNFSLSKKRENILSINMKILKREFYKKKNYE